MSYVENVLYSGLNLNPDTIEKISGFRRELSRNFSVHNQNRINDALTLMLEMHWDQRDRPNGSPYVEHPLGVAGLVMDIADIGDQDKYTDVVIAALLHDAVEDQSFKLANKYTYGKLGKRASKSEQQFLALKYIEKAFGSGVREYVAALTNPEFENNHHEKSIFDNWDFKHLEYSAHVYHAIQDPDVAIIKLADFSANALSLDQVQDDAKREKLMSKYTPVIRLFITRLNDEKNPVNIKADKKKEILDKLTQAQKTYQKLLES